MSNARADQKMGWLSCVAGGGHPQVIATLALLAWMSAAVAQTPPPKSASGADQASTALAEIVVTAERRQERIQDVPISVNAITGDLAADMSVTGSAGLVAVVPSLVVARQANSATPFLRGIGFLSGDINAENSVAIYIDGVYQPVGQGNFFEFNNIDRVEVMKGPQGTLFGRNATGGVIQILTKDPSFTPSGDVSIGYANYQTFAGTFYGTTGLSDTVAVDLAAMSAKQNDGWGHNLTTGAKTFTNNDQSFRGKLLFAPSPATKIVLAADYYHYENEGIGAQPAFGLSGDPANLNLGLPQSPANAIPGSPYVYPGRYNTWSDYPDTAYADNRGISLKIEHNFGATQFRSITSYRKFDGVWRLDQDMSPVTVLSAQLDQVAKTFSQEFHLFAPSDAKFQWLVGLFYFRNNSGFEPEHLVTSELLGPGAGGPVFGPFEIVEANTQTIATSLAAFAQGTYPVTDTTNLTVGIRDTKDKAEFTGSETGTLFPDLGGVTVPLVPTNTGELSYNKPTWRLSLDHKFTPDVLGYASYNRGIKSGNFSASVASAPAALYQPEQLDAYEVGLKTESLAHRLRVNGAAFYYDYKNEQFQKIVQGATVTFNAESAKLYGAELELDARATENLTLLLNVAYLHSAFGSFPYVATYRIPAGVSVNTDPGQYNADGNETPNSPEFSGNVGVDYRIPTSIGSFDLSANLYYTSKYYTEPDNRLYVQSHELLNAGLRWTDSKEKVSVRAWGKNLTNVYYYAQLTGQNGTADLAGPAAPRQYGVTAEFKF